MTLKSCCCGRPLRHGAKSIGITLLFLTLLGVPIHIRDAVTLSSAESQLESALASPGLDLTTVVNGRPLQDIVSEARLALRNAKTALAVGIVVTLLHLLFNWLLIRGVHRSAPRLLLAWLVFYAISFSLGVVTCLALMAAGGYVASLSVEAVDVFGLGAMSTKTLSIGFIVGGLVGLCLMALFWYLWAVVLAYRRELLRPAAGGGKRDGGSVEMGPPPPYQPNAPTYLPPSAAASQPDVAGNQPDAAANQPDSAAGELPTKQRY